jgi:hypothetical protein
MVVRTQEEEEVSTRSITFHVRFGRGHVHRDSISQEAFIAGYLEFYVFFHALRM